jgi:hypothetical protein
MRLALITLLAAASGIHPLGPTGTVPKGQVPAFRMKVNGGGAVFVHVCRSPRRVNGAICSSESVGRAVRGRGGIATYKPKAYDFPSYFANRPGTYYWQGERIACAGGDCRQEGPVVRFRVQ